MSKSLSMKSRTDLYEAKLDDLVNAYFHEFLELCKSFKSDLIVDNNKFLQLVLQLFRNKIDECPTESHYHKEQDTCGSWITLREFCKKYPICHQGTLSRYLLNDEKFYSECACRDRKYYYVDEERCLNYLCSHPNKSTAKKARKYAQCSLRQKEFHSPVFHY